jgi:hypothetical protein
LNTELRDSGRDLVQINDDGTHAILPVAMHLMCKVDHAGVPVMWLRHADGKLRRDGFPAALLQRPHAVDERGRVHGAPGLAVVVVHRVQAWRRGPCRKRERKRGWVRSSRRHGRLRGQDKSRKVRTVGLVRIALNSRLTAHIASISRNLHFSTTPYRRSAFVTLKDDHER